MMSVFQVYNLPTRFNLAGFLRRSQCTLRNEAELM